MAGKIMVFDLGEESNKIGKMEKIDEGHIEILKARERENVCKYSTCKICPLSVS